MATTTNYGWTTPDDTALVKDGASAIRTLGSSVDTTTKNLNPETTLGDLAYRSSTANVKTRLGLGTAGQFLAVNSGATAPEWQTLNAGGMTLLSTTSLTGASITVSSISQSYINLFLVVEDLYTANDQTAVNFRFNADSNANRHTQGNATSSSSIAFSLDSIGWFYGVSNSASYKKMGTMTIPNYTNATNQKFAQCNTTGFNAYVLANGTFNNFVGGYNQTSAISSFSLFPDSGNFSGGTVKVYGVK